MFASASAVAIEPEQRRELEALRRAGNIPQSVARKCRVILLAGEGLSNSSIARETGLSRPTVLAVRSAFGKGGVAALVQRQKRRRARPVLTADGAEDPECDIENQTCGRNPLECTSTGG